MREKADDRILELHPAAVLVNKRGLRGARLYRVAHHQTSPLGTQEQRNLLLL